jgi:manganese transport system substrate-binding protein
MVSRTVRGWSGLKGLATLMAVAGLVLAGCAPAPSAGGSGKPVVLTTFTVLADLTRNVGGEHVVVASIT